MAGELDYSKERLYSLKIRAIDSLTGSWSDTNCDVNILDVNDHYPMFDKPYYTVSKLENVRVGEFVKTFKLTVISMFINLNNLNRKNFCQYSII